MKGAGEADNLFTPWKRPEKKAKLSVGFSVRQPVGRRAQIVPRKLSPAKKIEWGPQGKRKQKSFCFFHEEEVNKFFALQKHHETLLCNMWIKNMFSKLSLFERLCFRQNGAFKNATELENRRTNFAKCKSCIVECQYWENINVTK